MGRKPSDKETKNVRFSIWLTPTAKEMLKNKAKRLKTSMQALIEEFARRSED